MDDAEFRAQLTDFCRANFGEGELARCERLSGGANMASWAFDWGGREYILRQLPEGAGHVEGEGALSLGAQAELIEIARRSGVKAPAVVARLSVTDGLGQGFVMDRVAGETMPHAILGQSRLKAAVEELPGDCARELAAIHAMDLAGLPGEIVARTPSERIELLVADYDAHGGAIPVYDAAAGWLREHCPEPAETVLLHGDFRMGNLVVDERGIATVLDWELAHIGDPLEDLAYLCTPSWRFGHWEKEAGGFASREELLEAYWRESGRTVSRARFDWWLLYNTLWWGVCCLRMGQSWRDGSMRMLERPIIGRRVSEVEIDLLLLLEPHRGASRPLSWAEPGAAEYDGESHYGELLAALREREKARLGDATGHSRFDALMAINALGMAQRQAELGPAFSTAHDARLAAMVRSKDRLPAQLRADWTLLRDDAVWDHLRLTAMERLTIDQPKYAGLAVAKERWT
ncbi:phosphotransferase family protein [Alteriqipengyuania flavescens]|uniref:phosphotransferase family protein n=1 Tax=Alteriqipengyuania flavescens TaxID=3053610 RepID=UPI0025B5DB86|nr:phosphotransferase family protein [Alteriqipengyuania flavescens]WJY18417.1 phosphotransferase family protein [Alteriqipengyuania flavescens]WJY24358.1 phosphotransferase family protein [Alteriqipengyuania flavescens]